MTAMRLVLSSHLDRLPLEGTRVARGGLVDAAYVTPARHTPAYAWLVSVARDYALEEAAALKVVASLSDGQTFAAALTGAELTADDLDNVIAFLRRLMSAGVVNRALVPMVVETSA